MGRRNVLIGIGSGEIELRIGERRIVFFASLKSSMATSNCAFL